jgi:hypothetical protein
MVVSLEAIMAMAIMAIQAAMATIVVPYALLACSIPKLGVARPTYST